MDSKQFAWTYLIENGEVDVTPGYYGGWENKVGKYVGCEYLPKLKNSALVQIRQHGVDWAASSEVTNQEYSRFVDTFSDSAVKEFLYGTLVLNNGVEQRWIASGLDVKNVFDMMAESHRLQNKFCELFEYHDLKGDSNAK